MKPTEAAAKAWLESQGVDGLVFQPNRSPDFLSSDGRGWEVKRLQHRTVAFTLAQVISLTKQPLTTVLFFRDGDPEPFTTAQFGALDLLGQHEGVYLRVIDDRAHVGGDHPITSSERLAELIRRGLAEEAAAHRWHRGVCSCGHVAPVAFGRLRQLPLAPAPVAEKAAA